MHTTCIFSGYDHSDSDKCTLNNTLLFVHLTVLPQTNTLTWIIWWWVFDSFICRQELTKKEVSSTKQYNKDWYILTHVVEQQLKTFKSGRCFLSRKHTQIYKHNNEIIPSIPWPINRCVPPKEKCYKGKEILKADSLPCMLMSVLPVCELPEVIFSSTLEIVNSKGSWRAKNCETVKHFSALFFLVRWIFYHFDISGLKKPCGQMKKKKENRSNNKENSTVQCPFPEWDKKGCKCPD